MTIYEATDYGQDTTYIKYAHNKFTVISQEEMQKVVSAGNARFALYVRRIGGRGGAPHTQPAQNATLYQLLMTVLSHQGLF